MEMDEDLKSVALSSLPPGVVSEMAMHLDTDGRANWEALADELLGFRLAEIQVVN